MLSGLGNCNRDAAGSCMVLNFDLRSLKIGYFYATNFCQVKKNMSAFTAFDFIFFLKNYECNFVTKIVLTYLRKKCSCDLENFLKFEAEGREFAKFLRSLEQFIQTVNFW